MDTDNLFGVWVAQDLDDPTKYAPFLLQGGLELPDRDFYLSSEARMVEIQTKYKAHVVNVLKLAGVADAEKKAAKIVELETKIAKVHADARGQRGREEGQQSLVAGRSREKARPAWTGVVPLTRAHSWTASSSRSSVWQPTDWSHPWNPPRSSEERESLDMRGRSWLTFHALERHRARSCRRSSSTKDSPSTPRR